MFPFLSLFSVDSWKQHRDLSSPIESAVSKNSLYTRTTNYIEGESPHLPRELDHSLGIAREEVPQTNFLLFSKPLMSLHISLNGFVALLRLWPRRKKCWSGRGSMKTADRKWWRWGKKKHVGWTSQWGPIQTTTTTKAPLCGSVKWEGVTIISVLFSDSPHYGHLTCQSVYLT